MWCRIIPSSSMHTPIIQIPMMSTSSFLKRKMVSFTDLIFLSLRTIHVFSSLLYSFFWFSYDGVEMKSQAQTKVREDRLISSLFRYFQMNNICRNKITIFFLWTKPQICMDSIFHGLGNVLGWRYSANSAKIGTHRDFATKLFGTLINSDVHSHALKKV